MKVIRKKNEIIIEHICLQYDKLTKDNRIYIKNMNENGIIGILKEALKFYADSNIYYPDNNYKTKIFLDNGEQARYALDLVNKLNEDANKLVDEYEDYIKNTDFSNSTDVMKKLKDALNIKIDSNE